MEHITKEEVLEIHRRLVIDAEGSDDPISPPGIKSENLLDSAISRQTVGIGEVLKYPDPVANAATLCYGICCNHSLHNGNKRTALVALMCHLDKNGLTFSDRATQETLYSFMLKLAQHKLVPAGKNKRGMNFADAEVHFMSDWVRKRTRRIEKGERSLSFSDLEKVLKQHNIHFGHQKNNTVDLIRYSTVTKKVGFLKTKSIEEEIEEKVANIPYWPGRSVGKNLVKSIRKQANLTHQDGIDSGLFYGTQTPPDDFIQRYKKVLRRLAKT